MSSFKRALRFSKNESTCLATLSPEILIANSQLKMSKIAQMSHLISGIISNLTSNFSPGFKKMLNNSSREPKIGIAYLKNMY